MSEVLGYSEFLTTLNKKPSLKHGLIVDTNVLISATYDSDKFFEPTTQFFDYLAEHEIPIYCNVNVRAEFLEIHRRIIFTEALIDFFREVDRTLLPTDISAQLGKWSANNKKRVDEQRSPLRLSEADIKKVKLGLMQIIDGEKNLWASLCENKIGNKLESLWNRTEDELGLNFLSTRNEDSSPLFNSSPEWSDAVRLIEKHGLSSSDAMIVNMFFCSNFDAIISSDQEVADIIGQSGLHEKICFVPDSLKLSMRKA
ncbi:MAG: hypothetical protein WA160_02365 [Pseudobdellovibrio sp.]